MLFLIDSEMEDLAKYIQSELHQDHLPGYYFSVEDVKDLILAFKAGARMKETIIKIVSNSKSSLYGGWYQELIGQELDCISYDAVKYDVIYKGNVRHVMLEDAKIIKEVK